MPWNKRGIPLDPCPPCLWGGALTSCSRLIWGLCDWEVTTPYRTLAVWSIHGIIPGFHWHHNKLKELQPLSTMVTLLHAWVTDDDGFQGPSSWFSYNRRQERMREEGQSYFHSNPSSNRTWSLFRPYHTAHLSVLLLWGPVPSMWTLGMCKSQQS